MRIVVTGGAGYLGSVLTNDLLSQGHSVVGMDNLMHGGESLAGLTGHPQFTLCVADVRDDSAVAAALQNADAVVHLAAIVGNAACNRDPALATAVNRDASLRLIDAAQVAGVQRFIFASTCSNYGTTPEGSGFVDETSPLHPHALYAETKVAVERHLLASAFPAAFVPTVLRLATVYGLSFRPRFDLAVNALAAEAVVNGKLLVRGERVWRPYVHVRDVSRAVTAVLGAPPEHVCGEVFNVGSTGENYTKKMLAELIIDRLPATIVEYGTTDPDARDYRVRCSKIENALGFRSAFTVPAGIDEVICAIRHGIVADFARAEYRN